MLVSACLFAVAPVKAQTTVWSATLTPKELGDSSLLGCNQSAGSLCATFLTNNNFTYGGVDYTVNFTTNIPSTGRLNIGLDKAIPQALTFHVGSTEFALSAATLSNSDKTATWNNTGLSWTLNQQVQLSLVEPPSTPTVSLSASPNPVPEGENVTVTATLSEALSEAVDIPVLPVMNTDVRGPGAILVLRGSTMGSEFFLATRDCDTEDETFTVELDTAKLPSLSLRAGTPSSLTIRIEDDNTEWCRSQSPPVTTGGGGGGGLPTPGSDDEPPPEDEEPQTSCPREDRETLVSFYEMTDGESWHEKENWNSEEPLDQWHGVETEDGNVVSLRLPDNGLSGDMPTRELLCLTELVELALWGNDDLSGEVPEELVLAVERAVLRDIAEMLDINPEWFENYGDPYDFEGWHEGVTTDDDGRVTELDLTGEGVIGEIPKSVSELQRLRDIMVTTSEGGCAVGGSQAHMKASALLAAVLILFALSRGLRARSD